MGESPRIPPFKKNGREKTKTPTKNGSRTWCNMLMGWCKSPTSTGNNISHLDLKHMYTYRARMYIWSILTISTQQVDTPKGALKKHLKGSGAAESHYDVPIPFQAMDPKSPDPPFANCGDQKPEMIQSIKKILQNEKTSPENFLSVISEGFLKFPSSSQALELFMRDSGTSPIIAAEDPEFVLLLVVKEFESTKQRLLLPFQLLTKSSWEGSGGERL